MAQVAAPKRGALGELIERLNTEQRIAVFTDDPNVAVIAGAGSGKTGVLTGRIARLVDEGVPSSRILGVTFTRAASAEMSNRVLDLVAGRRIPRLCTIHAWCYRFLRSYAPKVGLPNDFAVYDAIDSELVLRDVAGAAGVKNPDRARVKTLLGNGDVVRLYRERLRASLAVDYEMLQEYARIILRKHPDTVPHYEHLLIDEYQDVSADQDELLGLLAPKNVVRVGDPRQAIYSWRGAKPELFEAIVASPRTTPIWLTRNYRSTRAIVDYSNAVWAGSPYAPMVANRGEEGDVVIRTPQPDDAPQSELVVRLVRSMIASGTPTKDIAILARRWSPLLRTNAALVEAGISTTYYGEETDPWSMAIARPIVSLLSLIVQPHDVHQAIRLAGHAGIATPGRQLYAEALRSRSSVLEVAAGKSAAMRALWAVTRQPDRLDMAPAPILRSLVPAFRGLWRPDTEALVESLKDLTSLDAWAEWWTDRGLIDRAAGVAEGVAVMTIHASKGLEFPIVIGLSHTPADFPTTDPEANRLRYVLYTRARDELHLFGGTDAAPEP